MQAEADIAKAKRSLHAHLLELHQLIKSWRFDNMCLCYLLKDKGEKCLACLCQESVNEIDKLLANKDNS